MKAKLFIKTVLLLLGVAAPLFFPRDVAAQSSPTGTTWDCVLSGHRQGTAYLEFYKDFTFSGLEVLVPNKPKANEVGVGRNDGSEVTRGGIIAPPVGFQPGPQIYGSEPMEGRWGFDNKGQIIGQFIEVSPLESCVTNTFPLFTNIVAL